MLTSNCFGLTGSGPVCVERLTVAICAVAAVPNVFVVSRPMLGVVLLKNGGVCCKGDPGGVFVLTDPKGISVALMACELVAKTEILDVRCCLVSLVEESSAAKLKFLSLE